MYAKIYNNIIFPFYETILKGRSTIRYLKEIERSQWLPGAELDQAQQDKLKKLLSHAYTNVPYYRKKFDELKLNLEDIKTTQDLERLPVLTKDDIRNNQDLLIANDYKNRKLFNDTTGGSTGTPLKFKIDHDNYEWRQAFVKRAYGWAGYKDGYKTAFIWGASVCKEPFFKTLKHDLDETLKRHRLYNTFYFTEEKMAEHLSDMNKFRPKFIIAYTTPLYNFARFIKENKKQAWSPQSIIVGAEKLFLSQKQLIEEVFGAPVFETYGCREVTSIAAECDKRSGMHINAENVIVEIIKNGKPAKPEEIGNILITDLSNYAMPFIRYQNEDLGSFSEKKCACGRNLKLLKNIEGRVLDTIKTRDGRLIPGEFFIYWFMRFEEVKQFQIIQNSMDLLSVNIVAKERLSGERLEGLKKVILDIMGQSISVKFNFVDSIKLTKTGKFRVVISDIQVNFDVHQNLKETKIYV